MGKTTLAEIEAIFGLRSGETAALFDKLTAQEYRVAGMLAEGEPSKKIAAKLGISGSTFDVHRRRIQDKLFMGPTGVGRLWYFYRTCVALEFVADRPPEEALTELKRQETAKRGTR